MKKSEEDIFEAKRVWFMSFKEKKLCPNIKVQGKATRAIRTAVTFPEDPIKTTDEGSCAKDFQVWKKQSLLEKDATKNLHCYRNSICDFKTLKHRLTNAAC